VRNGVRTRAETQYAKARFEALRMDGYRDVVRELSQLATGLRDTNPNILAEWKFSAG
jgi:hypothetical protein